MKVWESEADCVRDVGRQDAGELGNELCEMDACCTTVCTTAPIWKPGTRHHAPREFWGWCHWRISARVEVPTRPGDSGLLCGGFAENKFTDWASLPGVNCKRMGARRILPRLLEWYRVVCGTLECRVDCTDSILVQALLEAGECRMLVL